MIFDSGTILCSAAADEDHRVLLDIVTYVVRRGIVSGLSLGTKYASLSS
jgi:hypothetical protein